MKAEMKGFTLLEVLVALAILAISATAVIRQTGGSVSQLATLETKTVATVLAENQLNLAIMADAFPTPGRSTRSITFNEQDWLVHTEVSDTIDPWLRKIKITVSLGHTDERPVASLVGYRGKH